MTGTVLHIDASVPTVPDTMEIVAKMSWGTMNADDNSWVCACEQASWDPPGGSETGYVNYWSYLEGVYPYHNEQDDDLRTVFILRLAIRFYFLFTESCKILKI